MFSQCRSNADEHTLTQISFSTNYWRWNNIGSSTLNRRNSVNVVSTLFCQRWNNVDKHTSAQLSFSTKYQRSNNVDERWSTLMCFLGWRYQKQVFSLSISADSDESNQTTGPAGNLNNSVPLQTESAVANVNSCKSKVLETSVCNLNEIKNPPYVCCWIQKMFLSENVKKLLHLKTIRKKRLFITTFSE